MLDKINEIKERALSTLKTIKNSKEIEEFKIKILGKKGELTSILKSLGSLSKEDRPKIGAIVNNTRKEIENKIENIIKEIKTEENNKIFETQKIDITLKGRKPKTGSVHPLRIILNQIEDIFLGMGFSIEEGPEVESEFYNFEALNFPPDHPAKDAQDTLYFSKDLLLRTHTSPVQIRTMKKMSPKPVRAIFPGRVFRRDTYDATHSPQFHQVEGLLVNKDVKFSDLTGVLLLFAKKMFGEDRKIRLRPSFFPFTEPSAEVDVSCMMCGGKGCSVCKGSGWIEILGAGAVHPNVLKSGGYDPTIVSGYAFGMGVDRIAMLKYKITDIRLFFEGDVRFLHQFK